MLPTYCKYLYYQSVIDMYTRGNVVACVPKGIPRTSTGPLPDGTHEGKKIFKLTIMGKGLQRYFETSCVAKSGSLNSSFP